MIQFYAPELLSTLSLPESEAQHCMRVLRKRQGDLITVVDGRGTRYTCRLVDEHARHPALEIVDQVAVPRSWHTHITVAVAPTKNIDRMEWLTEKLVEIGVDCIVPLLCRHSERREIKIERLERIAVSAMKQSLKAALPDIRPMTQFRQFVSECDASQRFFGYCDDVIERRLLSRSYKAGQGSVALLIGPEGDFDPMEVAKAVDAGFVAVTLGDNRLRTETAALVACDTIHVVDQISK